MNNQQTADNTIVVFKNNKIRRVFNENAWWFVLADVVTVLTDTTNVSEYIKKMRVRDEELSKGWGQIVTPLPVKTPGGIQKLNCAKTKKCN